jgi:hypothetical protein
MIIDFEQMRLARDFEEGIIKVQSRTVSQPKYYIYSTPATPHNSITWFYDYNPGTTWQTPVVYNFR